MEYIRRYLSTSSMKPLTLPLDLSYERYVHACYIYIYEPLNFIHGDQQSH